MLIQHIIGVLTIPSIPPSRDYENERGQAKPAPSIYLMKSARYLRRASLVPAIVERTKAKHSYQVPCAIALPILAGNPDHLAWIEAETAAHP